MNRDYVIVCNRHNYLDGCLLFWGVHTKDREKRSFAGYTNNIDYCEKYTIYEIKQEYDFPVYGVDINNKNYREVDDFAIKIEDLESLGYKKYTVYAR